jgi:hypothetical protein
MINLFTAYPKLKDTHKGLMDIIRNEVPTPNDFVKKILAI